MLRVCVRAALLFPDVVSHFIFPWGGSAGFFSSRSGKSPPPPELGGASEVSRHLDLRMTPI